MCKLKSAIILKDRIFMPDYDSHSTEKISNGSEDFEYCPHCGTKMDDTPQKEVRRSK